MHRCRGELGASRPTRGSAGLPLPNRDAHAGKGPLPVLVIRDHKRSLAALNRIDLSRLVTGGPARPARRPPAPARDSASEPGA